MKRLLIVPAMAALLSGGACQPVEAAPKAADPSECAVVGNMVFLGGVMAKHGFSQADALKFYPELYGEFYRQRGDDAAELARLSVGTAYAERKKNPKEPPIALGVSVTFACRQFQGYLDAILGTGT